MNAKKQCLRTATVLHLLLYAVLVQGWGDVIIPFFEFHHIDLSLWITVYYVHVQGSGMFCGYNLNVLSVGFQQ